MANDGTLLFWNHTLFASDVPFFSKRIKMFVCDAFLCTPSVIITRSFTGRSVVSSSHSLIMISTNTNVKLFDSQPQKRNAVQGINCFMRTNPRLRGERYDQSMLSCKPIIDKIKAI